MSENLKYSVELARGGSVWFIKNSLGKNVCGVAWTMFDGKSSYAKEFAEHVCDLLNFYESDVVEDVTTHRQDLIPNEQEA